MLSTDMYNRCHLYFKHQFVLHDDCTIYPCRVCLKTYLPWLITLMHFMQVLAKIQIFVCQFHARERRKRRLLFQLLHHLQQQSWSFCSSLVLWLSIEGKEKEVLLSLFSACVIIITFHQSEVVYKRCIIQSQLVLFFL